MGSPLKNSEGRRGEVPLARMGRDPTPCWWLWVPAALRLAGTTAERQYAFLSYAPSEVEPGFGERPVDPLRQQATSLASDGGGRTRCAGRPARRIMRGIEPAFSSRPIATSFWRSLLARRLTAGVAGRPLQQTEGWIGSKRPLQEIDPRRLPSSPPSNSGVGVGARHQRLRPR